MANDTHEEDLAGRAALRAEKVARKVGGEEEEAHRVDEDRSSNNVGLFESSVSI